MTFSARQREIIADNLRAFINNFGPVKFEKADYGGGWYVFYPADSDSYIHFCHNIHYLDGWLYGAVQAVHRIAPTKERDGIRAQMDEYSTPAPDNIQSVKAAHTHTTAKKGV